MYKSLYKRWRPANELEKSLVAAAESDHRQEFGRLLRNAPLYLPMRSGRPASVPDWLPSPQDFQTYVFTSPETLFEIYKAAATEYREVDLETLRAELGPEHQLVFNSNTPISATLRISSVDEIAAGRKQLRTKEEVQDSRVSTAYGAVRDMVLHELGSDQATAERALPPHDPFNELESVLTRCVVDDDFERFMVTLADNEVVVPLTKPWSDQTGVPNLPWLTIRPEDAPVIPVFSSVDVLERITSRVPHYARVAFVDVLTFWPSQRHWLYFNPGTRIEHPLIGPEIEDTLLALHEIRGD